MYMESESRIRIAVICGSVRPGNYTAKAVRLVMDELKSQDVAADLIDPAPLDLPLPGQKGNKEAVTGLQETVETATGVIFATPEYHGGFSSVSKLVIDNLGFPSKLSGKPMALLGVAAGSIGAIKALEQLRGVCSHVGALVLPGSVSVAKVREQFDADGNALDPRVEDRIRMVPRNLLDYIRQHLCPRLTLEAMAREE